MPENTRAALVVSRGFCSDFAIGYLIGFAGWLLNLGQPLFWALWMAWCLFAAFNMDHIRINDSNVNYVHMHFVVNRQFLLGCILALRNLYHWALILSCSGIVVLVLIWGRLLPQMTATGTFIVAFACLLIFILSTSPLSPNWVQMNPIEENLRRLAKRPADRPEVLALGPTERKMFFDRDLTGMSVISYPSDPQNVLLVILENLSFDTAFSGQMPHLEGLAGKHISYGSFMSLQRQSNRGFYALMCGDYPNCIGLEAKADILLAANEARIALPSILAANGYRTLFMEANDLGFFQRGEFCRKIGFQKSFGESDYPEALSGKGWGVADRILFRHAFKEIGLLHKSDQPWFATLFTGGTHYPYTVPGVVSPSRAQAIASMDESLKEFLEEMEQQGVLSNTLVIITSDEAIEASGKGIQRELRMHHVPLVVMAPQNRQAMHPVGLFCQRDLLLSICDYFGLESPGAVGRSIFRTYRDDQSVIFANVYTSRRYAYLSRGQLYAYSVLADQWLAYRVPRQGLFLPSLPRSLPDPKDIAAMEEVFSFNEASFDQLEEQVLYRRTDTEYAGRRKLLGGHRISCKRGDRIRWKIVIDPAEPVELRFVVTFRNIPVSSENNPRPIFKRAKCAGGGPCVFRHEFTATGDIDAMTTNVHVEPSGGKTYLVREVSIERSREPSGVQGGVQ